MEGREERKEERKDGRKEGRRKGRTREDLLLFGIPYRTAYYNKHNRCNCNCNNAIGLRSS
jgi:hypothetical protein